MHALLICLFGLLHLGMAHAQEAPIAAPVPSATEIVLPERVQTLATEVDAWPAAIAEKDGLLQAQGVDYRTLDRLRDEFAGLHQRADDVANELGPRLAEALAQQTALGPVPAAGAGEAEGVARARAEAAALVNRLNETQRGIDATRVRTDQLLARVQDVRRQLFTGRLTARVPGLFSAASWQALLPGTLATIEATRVQLVRWWAGVDEPELVAGIFAAALLAGLVAWMLSRMGIRRLRAQDIAEDYPFWKRAAAGAWVVILRILPVVLTASIALLGLSAADLLGDRTRAIFEAFAEAAIVFTAVSALAMTVLAPGRPRWRLMPASDAAARTAQLVVLVIAAVYAANLVLGRLAIQAGQPVALSVVQGFVASVGIGGLLALLLRLPLGSNGHAPAGANWLALLRWPAWGVVLLVVGAALAGFVGLAQFVAAQAIVTATILGIVYLLLLWVDALGASLADGKSRAGGFLASRLGLSPEARDRLALPLGFILKFALLLVAVPLILVQWGFDWRDVTQWGRNLFFGFQVGSTQISVAAILAAILVFSLASAAARLLQRWLDAQVLAPSGISGSARDSIRTGMGYLGIIVAGLLALSYSGLDLSNVAIIAGALSVGIGFGLQAIISNFVSGLILLAERPIKVGDWIVVGEDEGIVKRISVRSTEIETFDRAAVIVPNSNFITGVLKNWTLHNNIARTSVEIPVDGAADPDGVTALLLEIAGAHPQVMPTPAPIVYFAGFSGGALDFRLHVYLYNVNRGMTTRTELRLAALKALRERQWAPRAPDAPLRAEDIARLLEAFRGETQPAVDGFRTRAQ